ncbi:Retrotransposon gag domain [Sesbania bispinosa]|nr:Retrotransposon gag domain [Sesbania bispinosa]
MEDIKKRFSVVNGPRIQQLKSNLAECKQGDMTMVSYYGKMKALWDELANYEQIPTCTCEGCKLQEERIKAINRVKDERGEIVGLVVQTSTRTKGCGEAKGKTMIGGVIILEVKEEVVVGGSMADFAWDVEQPPMKHKREDD